MTIAAISDSSTNVAIPIAFKDNGVLSFFHLERTDTTQYPKAEPAMPNAPTWELGVLVLVLAIIAWIRATNRKRVEQLFQAFMSNRFTRQLTREEQLFSNRSSIALTMVFILLIGLLLTLYVGKTPPRTTLSLFLLITLGVLLYQMVKLVLVGLSAIVFNLGTIMTEYSFNFFLFNMVLGVGLFPILIVALLVPWVDTTMVILVGMGVMTLGFLVRLGKVAYLGNREANMPLQYIIVYLCALEILPLVVIIKLFIGDS